MSNTNERGARGGLSSHISEIVPDNGPHSSPQPPLDDWDLQVVESGLSVNLGKLGGRQEFVANARVHVTEEDGTSWTGLTILG